MSIEEVEKAAAYLDSMVNKAGDWLTTDWRDRIDVPRLDMGSCDDCILGQLHGNYSDARAELIAWDRKSFFDVSGCFSRYTEEWKEYLQKPQFDVNAEWLLRGSGVKATIGATFRSDGRGFVTYRQGVGSTWFTVSMERFMEIAHVKPKPRFTKGDRLKGRSGVNYYYFTDEKVIRISGSRLQWSPLDWWEREEGAPLAVDGWSDGAHFFSGEFFWNDGK
jgi:hypothetical protein